MNSVQPVDFIVIGFYFLLMLGIGAYVLRANRSARDYFAGSNAIPWWVSGMTMYMANFSAWTFSGAAGFTYETGWFAIAYFAIWPLAYLAGSRLTAVRWRRTRSISPVEYTRTRFNRSTQQVFSWVLASNFVLTGGVQLAAVCKLLAPVLRMDITMLVLITGTVILLYTFLGGIWAVSITDVVQGLILLSITCMILPASISLAGGWNAIVAAIPAVQFTHMYNGVTYDPHWLVSIFIIMSVGVAAGQAQRFYCVRDERSARRVGRFAALLYLTVPLVFGIPPLAAKVLWPDLSAVEFFRPYAAGNPQDLVFIALCMKILPAGLVGFFVAAMLAATMSTLSAVYNMVSSVIAKDIFHDLFRPQAGDARVLRAGRLASVAVGAVVTMLALLFIHSSFGIFNTMQVFYTLLNIPIVVPIAVGLLWRKASPWSGLAAIGWGLVIGVTGKYVLGWQIGAQVYAQVAFTAAVMAGSVPLGRAYREHPRFVYAAGIGAAILLTLLFRWSATDTAMSASDAVSLMVAIGLGVAVPACAALFARRDASKERELDEFFTKLSTPVDAEAEVGNVDLRMISVYSILRAIAGLLALLVLGIAAFTRPSAEGGVILMTMTGIFLFFSILMHVALRKEIRKSSALRIR